MDTKAKIILELVCSLNKGDCGYVDNRVKWAIDQYNQMVEAGVITGSAECEEVNTFCTTVDRKDAKRVYKAL